MPNALDIGIVPPATPALVAPGFDATAVYDRIRSNLRQIDGCWFKVCEDLRLLKDKGYSVREIAQEIGEAKSTVQDYLALTERFPDKESLTLPDGQVAGLTSARSANKIIQRIERKGGKPDPQDILFKVVAESKTSRTVRREFEQQRQAEEIQRLLDLKQSVETGLEDCFNMDCRDVARLLAERGVKLDMIWLDMPYVGYADYQVEEDYLRGNDSSASVMNDCDFKTEEEAVGIMVDLIPLLTPLVHERTVVVYWANGRKHDHEDVTRAFRVNGWDSVQASLWVKPMTPAGSMDSADAANGERYIVWTRSGAAKTWANELGRGGLIRGIPPCRQDVRHNMEKPQKLAEHFFSKYLEPKSLVWDAYGCSGSACCAAIAHPNQHGFIYSESNKNNFEYGTGRIAEALKRKRAETKKEAPAEGEQEAAPVEDLPF